MTTTAFAAFGAAGAFAHGGNNDPNAIHACVNRLGEERIHNGTAATPIAYALIFTPS